MSNEELCSIIQMALGEDQKNRLLELYQQNIRLLKSICRKYNRYRNIGEKLNEEREAEELLQQAYIGFHKAALTYDVSSGCVFSTYLVTIVKRELYRYKITCGSPIRVNAEELKLYYDYQRFTEYVETNYGRNPTMKEYTCYLEISEKKVLQVQKYAHDSYVVSLDSPVEGVDGDISELADFVPDERSDMDHYIEQWTDSQNGKMVRAEVERLEPLHQYIIKQRLENVPLSEIAKELGKTINQVAGMERKAYNQLANSKILWQLLEEAG